MCQKCLKSLDVLSSQLLKVANLAAYFFPSDVTFSHFFATVLPSFKSNPSFYEHNKCFDDCFPLNLYQRPVLLCVADILDPVRAISTCLVGYSDVWCILLL